MKNMNQVQWSGECIIVLRILSLLYVYIFLCV